VGIPSWMGFSRPQLVVVLGLFLHDGILAITKPFFTNFISFFTMEFWLSRSLFSRTFFFHNGILAITKPFSRTFFFHDGILAITKPFFTNFISFFTMEFWLSRSLSHELSFFTMEFWKYAIWGKTLFIHISQRVFT
jgi:hypothetical protein